MNQHLPTTERIDLRSHEIINPYLDLICNSPPGRYGDMMPVGTVSKTYGLIPHNQLFGVLCKKLGSKSGDFPTVLRTTPMGERVRFDITIPGNELIPADGHPISMRLIVVNSVEGSVSFKAMIGWFRFVCENGMIIGTESSRMTSRHFQNLTIENVEEAIGGQLTLAVKTSAHFKAWNALVLMPEAVKIWVNKTLAEKWGPQSAARVWRTWRTGSDGIPKQRSRNCPATDWIFDHTTAVRGAVLNDSAYSFLQALTWVASRRRSVQDQLQQQRDSVEFMKVIETMTP